MTFAPDSLKAARRYLLDELDMHPGEDVGADLDPDEVGIVSSGYGDSYHRGKGYIGSGSYSAYFERDRRGLSGASSALDIGMFNVVKGSRRLTLFRFNAWIVRQCEANTSDTRDIREVIYTLDGRTVKRWDRHRRRDSGDSSHLWHTHISYYRDSEHRDKTGLFRRYLGEDDVSAKDVWQTDGIVPAPRVDGLGRPKSDADMQANPHWWAGNMLRNGIELTSVSRGEQLAQHEALMAALKAHADMPDADFEQLKAAAKAGAAEALAAADIAVTWGPRGE